MDYRRTLATAALLCSCVLFVGSLTFAGHTFLARSPSPATAMPLAQVPEPTVEAAPTSTRSVATATATGRAANSPTPTRRAPAVAVMATPAQPPPTTTPTVASAPTEPPEPAMAPTPITSPSPIPPASPEGEVAAEPPPDPTATAPPLPPAGTATPQAPPTPAPPSGAGIADSARLPARLLIPRLSVDAPVGYVGQERDGSMATPGDAWSTGWYALGARPGEVGNAVITGHVDYHDVGPAVFWDLHRLAPNDEVLVVTGDGTRLRFVVVATTSYTMAGTPLERIFGPAGVPNLNLITCGGTFNRNAREYDRRVVVYTTYVGQQ